MQFQHGDFRWIPKPQLSNPTIDIQILPVFCIQPLAILREQFSFWRQQAANPRNPHNSSMYMTAQRQICSPCKVTLCWKWTMCQQNGTPFSAADVMRQILGRISF